MGARGGRRSGVGRGARETAFCVNKRKKNHAAHFSQVVEVLHRRALGLFLLPSGLNRLHVPLGPLRLPLGECLLRLSLPSPHRQPPQREGRGRGTGGRKVFATVVSTGDVLGRKLLGRPGQGRAGGVGGRRRAGHTGDGGGQESHGLPAAPPRVCGAGLDVHPAVELVARAAPCPAPPPPRPTPPPCLWLSPDTVRS